MDETTVVSLGFLFYPRTDAPVPTGRSDNQIFGHCGTYVEDLVFDCGLYRDTQWYDLGEYLDHKPPLICFHFLWEGDTSRLVAGLKSGLRYSLKDLAREVKHGVEIPEAVTCVWGGRRMLRNIGDNCNARTPDEFFRHVLCLAEAVQTPAQAPHRLREARIELSSRGFTPDSTFYRGRGWDQQGHQPPEEER